MSREKSNPYSSRGLDQLARLNTELTAKREYVAKKKGVPEDAVKFAYCDKLWVPVVVKNNNTNNGRRAPGDWTLAPVERNNNRHDGHRAAGDSIPPPLETINNSSDGHGGSGYSTEAPVVTVAPVESKAIQESKFEKNEFLELENIHGAIGILIVLVCITYGGTLGAILCACAYCWWCVLVIIRRGKHGSFYDKTSRIRMTIDVQSKREKVRG